MSLSRSSSPTSLVSLLLGGVAVLLVVFGWLDTAGLLSAKERKAVNQLEQLHTSLSSPTPLATVTVRPDGFVLPDQLPSTYELATVSAVVDGDTITLTDGRKVRYIGVDTPETKHPRQGQECFGSEASTYNTQLVAGQTLALSKDVSETDRYGRLLRYVYILDSAQKPVSMVNAQLVQAGMAEASAYPPDVLYQAWFEALEAEARQSERGLWHPEACIR